jgi:hypothetical protein
LRLCFSTKNLETINSFLAFHSELRSQPETLLNFLADTKQFNMGINSGKERTMYLTVWAEIFESGIQTHPYSTCETLSEY